MTDSARPFAYPKVMIVDDDPVIIKIIERMLARRGVKVVTSLRSLGILNLIATHRPALVILDVNMPALGGPSLVKLVREDPELRGTKIILHSGLEKDLLAAKAKECGADGYVTKGTAVAASPSTSRSGSRTRHRRHDPSRRGTLLGRGEALRSPAPMLPQMHDAARESILNIASQHRTLEEVVRWGLSSRPPRMIQSVVVQDEYTHDVVLAVGEGVYLVYDTT